VFTKKKDSDEEDDEEEHFKSNFEPFKNLTA
jgi:hypothetical protein